MGKPNLNRAAVVAAPVAEVSLDTGKAIPASEQSLAQTVPSSSVVMTADNDNDTRLSLADSWEPAHIEAIEHLKLAHELIMGKALTSLSELARKRQTLAGTQADDSATVKTMTQTATELFQPLSMAEVCDMVSIIMVDTKPNLEGKALGQANQSKKRMFMTAFKKAFEGFEIEIVAASGKRTSHWFCESFAVVTPDKTTVVRDYLSASKLTIDQLKIIVAELELKQAGKL